jgi:hypothetical protein
VLRMMMAGALVMVAGYGLGAEAGPAPLAEMSADEQGIRQAVQYYFDGGRNADSATMGKGFEASVAHMLYVRDNQLNDVPIPQFLARIAAQRTPEFKPDSNQRRVVSVDFAGNSGIAKLETITPQYLVIDYMSLLKVDGRWKIVNKIFDRLPR